MEQAGTAWAGQVVRHQELLHSALAQIHDEMARQRGEFYHLRELASGCSGNISQLQGETSQLKQDIAGLSSDKSVLQNQIDRLCDELADLRGENARLRSELTEQRNSMDILRGGQDREQSDAPSLPAEAEQDRGDIVQPASDVSMLQVQNSEGPTAVQGLYASPEPAQIAEPEPALEQNRSVAPEAEADAAETDGAASGDVWKSEAALAAVLVQPQDITPLLEAIARTYPYGTRLDALTLQVLNSSLDREVTEAEADAVKQAMFCAADGNYHVPSSICPEAVRREMLEQAQEWLASHGAFAAARWRELYRERLNLHSLETDFLAFARQYLLPQLPELCTEGEGEAALIADADRPLADLRKLWADELVQSLRDAEPLTREEVLKRFAWLTAEHLLELELPEDELLIRYEQEGREYWTLLSSLGFEADFPQVLEEAIEALEEEEAPVTLSSIAAKLEDGYGFTSFYESYALSDRAFKAIVDACTAESGRTWQRGFYQRDGDELPLDLVDAYAATRPGIFNNETFIDFAVRNGYIEYQSLNSNVRTNLCQRLCKKFLRLGSEKWISRDEFVSLSCWSPRNNLLIAELLEHCLGDNDFLPMVRCFEKVHDQLPELQGISWTPYLLVSVGKRLCAHDKITVVNDLPIKKIAAQLVPANVGDSMDGRGTGMVEYVLKVYKKKGYRLNNYNEVFARLRTDCVRYSRSSEVNRCIAEIYGYAPPALGQADNRQAE